MLVLEAPVVEVLHRRGPRRTDYLMKVVATVVKPLRRLTSPTDLVVVVVAEPAAVAVAVAEKKRWDLS